MTGLTMEVRKYTHQPGSPQLPVYSKHRHLEALKSFCCVSQTLGSYPNPHLDSCPAVLDIPLKPAQDTLPSPECLTQWDIVLSHWTRPTVSGSQSLPRALEPCLCLPRLILRGHIGMYSELGLSGAGV